MATRGELAGGYHCVYDKSDEDSFDVEDRRCRFRPPYKRSERLISSNLSRYDNTIRTMPQQMLHRSQDASFLLNIEEV